jgi:hypothetical protein
VKSPRGDPHRWEFKARFRRRWLVEGYGYDITGGDVWAAYSSTLRAAEKAGVVAETRERIGSLVAGESPGGFVRQILGKDLAL